MVYPRTGGGNIAGRFCPPDGGGLSPHGRGKHRDKSPHVPPPPRSIPARAGETLANPLTRSYSRVYPRTGGGNSDSGRLEFLTLGLSPHGRGKRRRRRGGYGGMGSIPARAGETSSASTSSRAAWVYPRTGGGNAASFPPAPFLYGLSPHGRGKLPAMRPASRRPGSIPARAGETRSGHRRRRATRVYPRTGGGNRPAHSPATTAAGLSPHGRGKPQPGQLRDRPGRSIPARAGETRARRATRRLTAVYPRTGGGNARNTMPNTLPLGLSPHGRGKPYRRAVGL